ncbi:MAG TPA: halocarboxylic acid dehydrogenase DehI family protein, partial [Patescibacteria group bacterium]|nr:halocarboxylic acid dehydrogenase DehI family protein [Patescibacteria group bacterium]
PISQEQASGRILEIYTDIQSTFQVSLVPLVFQYIANFEEYFSYMWEKVKRNIQSDYFENSYKELLATTTKDFQEIYYASSQMQEYLHRLHGLEKDDLLDTVSKLAIVNAKLLIVTIGIREGVKGVMVKHEQLPKSVMAGIDREFFDTFSNIVQESQQKEAAATSKMLAPLFGTQALAFSNYSDFFSEVAQDFEALIMKESYLEKRVILEKKVMHLVDGLPYGLGCTYAEIARFAAGKAHFSELLYILSETFPSQFPRLMFTSILMKQVLSPSSGLQKI